MWRYPVIESIVSACVPLKRTPIPARHLRMRTLSWFRVKGASGAQSRKTSTMQHVAQARTPLSLWASKCALASSCETLRRDSLSISSCSSLRNSWARVWRRSSRSAMEMAERPTRHDNGWLKDRLRSPESSSTSTGGGRVRDGMMGQISHGRCEEGGTRYEKGGVERGWPPRRVARDRVCPTKRWWHSDYALIFDYLWILLDHVMMFTCLKGWTKYAFVIRQPFISLYTNTVVRTIPLGRCVKEEECHWLWPVTLSKDQLSFYFYLFPWFTIAPSRPIQSGPVPSKSPRSVNSLSLFSSKFSQVLHSVDFLWVFSLCHRASPTTLLHYHRLRTSTSGRQPSQSTIKQALLNFSWSPKRWVFSGSRLSDE